MWTAPGRAFQPEGAERAKALREKCWRPQVGGGGMMRSERPAQIRPGRAPPLATVDVLQG